MASERAKQTHLALWAGAQETTTQEEWDEVVLSVVKECSHLREVVREIAVYGNKHMPANEYALRVLEELDPAMYAATMEVAKKST